MIGYDPDRHFARIGGGTQVFLYYGGSASHHDWWAFGKSDLDTPEAEPGYRVRHGMGLATIRVEGFVSLDAGLREGAVCTKPFFSAGARLIVNGRCDPGGYIAAAIMDTFEEPWEGFGREECIPFIGDSVNQAFAWRGKGRRSTQFPATSGSVSI